MRSSSPTIALMLAPANRGRSPRSPHDRITRGIAAIGLPQNAIVSSAWQLTTPLATKCAPGSPGIGAATDDRARPQASARRRPAARLLVHQSRSRVGTYNLRHCLPLPDNPAARPWRGPPRRECRPRPTRLRRTLTQSPMCHLSHATPSRAAVLPRPTAVQTFRLPEQRPQQATPYAPPCWRRRPEPGGARIPYGCGRLGASGQTVGSPSRDARGRLGTFRGRPGMNA
jgi:hypothetical protein